MARYLEGNVTVADNEYDFREVCRALRVPDAVSTRLASETVNNISQKMREEGVEGSLAKYYNTYRQGKDTTLNAFSTHRSLEPIAHLFRLKSNIRISRDKRVSHEYCTFTMLQKHYDYYREHGKPPKVEHNGSTAKYGTKKRTLIKFDGKNTVKLPINETWKRFKYGIKAFNIQNGSKYTIPEMVILALEEYMDGRADVFPKKQVKFDDDQIKLTQTHRINVPVEPELINDLRSFIHRYNCMNTPKTTIRDVVPRAIRQFLDRMPIMYTRPDLYAEELALQQEQNT